MDFEFESAARRFSKEHQSQKAKAKEKAKKQAQEREEIRAKQARWEAEARKRREEEAVRAAEEAARRDEDLERNRGIAYVQTLRPELTTAAEAKGIVRRCDKICLPRSASSELDSQHASKNGQLFFELSTPSGRVTHASILDFSAQEGTVGAPAELLRILGLADIADGTAGELRPQLTVRYRALKRGTFARVQPVAAAFSSDVGDVKLTLERELQLRTTLSAGDELRVHEGGAAYALRIISLEPEDAASIIDTDLEVEVLPSVEHEEAVAAEAARQAEAEAALEAARAEAAARAAAAERDAQARAQAAEAAAAEAVAARSLRREKALAVLPAEPAAGTDGATTVAVRCPDGTRCSRRFASAADDASALFALVESSAWEDCPSDFTLVASYPRRVIRRADAAIGRTIAEVGLTGKQEALFVEVDAHAAEEAAEPMAVVT
jgi:ubiquitin fusion degradation protein 1